jgi:hypothetical protein
MYELIHVASGVLGFGGIVLIAWGSLQESNGKCCGGFLLCLFATALLYFVSKDEEARSIEIVEVIFDENQFDSTIQTRIRPGPLAAYGGAEIEFVTFYGSGIDWVNQETDKTAPKYFLEDFVYAWHAEKLKQVAQYALSRSDCVCP